MSDNFPSIRCTDEVSEVIFSVLYSFSTTYWCMFHAPFFIRNVNGKITLHITRAVSEWTIAIYNKNHVSSKSPTAPSSSPRLGLFNKELLLLELGWVWVTQIVCYCLFAPCIFTGESVVCHIMCALLYYYTPNETGPSWTWGTDNN